MHRICRFSVPNNHKPLYNLDFQEDPRFENLPDFMKIGTFPENMSPEDIHKIQEAADLYGVSSIYLERKIGAEVADFVIQNLPEMAKTFKNNNIQ